MFKLKELRKKYNVFQKEIAEYLQVSQGNISDMETGRIEPDVYKIVKIAEFFNITTDELLGKDTLREKTFTAKQITYNPDELELLNAYRCLDDIEKETAIEILKVMIKSKVK